MHADYNRDSNMTKQELLLARREHLFPAELHYYGEPLVITRAKGTSVFDIDGKEYIDFFGGILVISVGHCNEEVNARIKRQLDTLAHTSTLFATEPPVQLATTIGRLSPGRKLTKCFFSNSGTEANEMAVLAARAATGANEVIALRYGYHGRTGMAMAMSGQSTWRVGTQAAPGFAFAHNASGLVYALKGDGPVAIASIERGLEMCASPRHALEIMEK
jgi:4-aminobutyrate aminotransferase-like enzyme